MVFSFKNRDRETSEVGELTAKVAILEAQLDQTSQENAQLLQDLEAKKKTIYRARRDELLVVGVNRSTEYD